MKICNTNKLSSSQLDSAIYAMILGDASCDRGGGNFTENSNFILKIGHSKNQKEYLLWKKEIIDQVGTVKTRIYDYDKTNSTYLITNARRYFTKLEKIFYKDRKKLINKKILKKLDSLALAIWFMDDGYVSCNKSGSFYGELCVDQFSLNEVELIKNWFIEKFRMEVGIRKLEYKSGKYKGKIAYRIKFNKENCKKLKQIVGPYVNEIPCMNYKLSKIK